MSLPTPINAYSGVGAASSSCNASTAIPSTSGSLLLAVVTAGALSGTGTSINSVTDNIGNTWVVVDSSLSNASVNKVRGALYMCANALGGVTSVTANLNQPALLSEIVVVEYALGGTSPLDQHAYAVGNGAQPQIANSGSASTTTKANELVIGWCAASGTTGVVANSPSPPNNQTTRIQANASLATITDELVSSPGNYSASYSLGSSGTAQWVCGVATFIQQSVTTETITGLSRITEVDTKTISAKGFIGSNTVKTINARSRLTNSTPSVISSVSRITAATSGYQSGQSRIRRVWPGTNLILNGDFELGSGNTFTYWGQTVTGSSTVTQDTATVFTGNRSVLLTTDSIGDLTEIYTSSSVTVKPLTTYILSFWSKNTLGEQVAAIVNDGSGHYLQPDGSWSSSGANALVSPYSTAWTLSSLRFTTQSSQTHIVLYLKRNNGVPNGKNWIDQVGLYEATLPIMWGLTNVVDSTLQTLVAKSSVATATTKTLYAKLRVTASTTRQISARASILIVVGNTLHLNPSSSVTFNPKRVYRGQLSLAPVAVMALSGYESFPLILSGLSSTVFNGKVVKTTGLALIASSSITLNPRVVKPMQLQMSAGGSCNFILAKDPNVHMIGSATCTFNPTVWKRNTLSLFGIASINVHPTTFRFGQLNLATVSVVGLSPYMFHRGVLAIVSVSSMSLRESSTSILGQLRLAPTSSMTANPTCRYYGRDLMGAVSVMSLSGHLICNGNLVMNVAASVIFNGTGGTSVPSARPPTYLVIESQ